MLPEQVKEGSIMIPKDIGLNHILKAIGEIDAEGIPKGRESSKFSFFMKENTILQNT